MTVFLLLAAKTGLQKLVPKPVRTRNEWVTSLWNMTSYKKFSYKQGLYLVQNDKRHFTTHRGLLEFAEPIEIRYSP